MAGFGLASDERQFGHAGAGCVMGWADPESQIGVDCCTNGNRQFIPGMRRGEISSLILKAAL